MKEISCSDMIREYLEKNGYDGLVDSEIACSCKLDDLMPCGNDMVMDCVAGHKVEGCNPDCGGGCDFHIVAGEKPK